MIDHEQVRTELLAIINANPENVGRLPGSSDCVYFHNKQAGGGPDLTRPCCIVGYWLYRHPDVLLSVETYVRRNDQWLPEEIPADDLTETAMRLLADVQVKQDGPPTVQWKNLRPFVEGWGK